MNWFEDQIKQRTELDNEMFSNAFLGLANSITGIKSQYDKFELIEDPIKEILRFYRFDTDYKIPNDVNEFYDKLDYLCAKVGLSYREVKLTEGWYKTALGSFIAFRKDNHTAIALIPCFSGYKFLDNGKYKRVTKKNQKLFEVSALCFYKSFPNTKLKIGDLMKYAFASVPVKYFVGIVILMLCIILMGVLVPKLTYFLYDTVIESDSFSLLWSTITFFIAISFSTALLKGFHTLYTNTFSTIVKYSVESATTMRIFSLKPSFFRTYSPGELTARSQYVPAIATSVMDLIFVTGLSSLLSLVYIGSISEFASSLVLPALLIILVTIIASVITTLIQIKISRKRMELAAKESGLTYSAVNGVTKIRLAGAEKRVFAKWASIYSKEAKLSYAPPFFAKYSSAIIGFITLVGSLLIYFFAIKTNITIPEYSAFISAYGLVFGAFTSLSGMASKAASIKPNYDLAKPILEAEPEIQEDKLIVNKLSGEINLSKVSFRYSESMPLVIDELSLKIKPGQYVAIVGKTGCGKSTLIRLLLGFEKPNRGSIYYDGKDLRSLNLRSLRRKIGTVVQDGKLFQGDIFSNIAVCAPNLTLDEAYKCADIAGIGDDIREMPMGMSTFVSDGGGGVSGGQKQRILIARAIAPKPSILIFDEATNALDNITQKKVSEALDSLRCTRIVIAHRLSTIKQCDRILYLEKGKIVEDGTYDELMSKNDKFADLVKHQMIDSPEQ